MNNKYSCNVVERHLKPKIETILSNKTHKNGLRSNRIRRSQQPPSLLLRSLHRRINKLVHLKYPQPLERQHPTKRQLSQRTHLLQKIINENHRSWKNNQIRCQRRSHGSLLKKKSHAASRLHPRLIHHNQIKNGRRDVISDRWKK